jgi:hypothetical protein
MFRQLGRLPDARSSAFHTAEVMTIRQNATSSAGVPARFTKVDANEKTVIVIATAIAPRARLRSRIRQGSHTDSALVVSRSLTNVVARPPVSPGLLLGSGVGPAVR